MTSLAPLYLLGLFAISAPILFHLWRRTPQGRRSFSTLMFLRPSPPRMTSRSRVEHWGLLLLRAAALAILAISFTRPLIRTASSRTDSAGKTELVAILVDTSA
ncbi:MAG: alpha-1-antitrypsin, partial [Planctomycetes bacterium]|nr:alpha-1-antitrypsin [Planctomycetota bacterium]